MAELRFDRVAHAYQRRPGAADGPDWAVKETDHTWRDGGAFALLGPSGCGKTTMLNLLSGLLAPRRGRVWFDDREVSHRPPQQRNIAQIFQFPVVYDTMSVRDNLAFPLRNRGLDARTIAQRVTEVAEALELGDQLERRAAGLSADSKQKISMGRGLVRTDVSAILLDEPLTVIDPALRWRLRSNLKALHRRFRHTMIYVTHDQTEALTFAERIVVMHAGRIMQEGDAAALFSTPRHRFVGHFIGSPGMNFAACEFAGGAARLGDAAIPLAYPPVAPPQGATVELGVRPEFVRLGRDGLEARITRMTDIGHCRIAEVAIAGVAAPFKAVLAEAEEIPAAPRVSFAAENTYLYYDGWLAAPAS